MTLPACLLPGEHVVPAEGAEFAVPAWLLVSGGGDVHADSAVVVGICHVIVTGTVGIGYVLACPF